MILIIDNYDSFTYNLYQIVATITENVTVIRNDKITIEEIEQLKPRGIILSPGPGRPENAGICVDVIKRLSDKMADKIAILGVCLGHQAIASAFGGEVIHSKKIVHGKSSVVSHHGSALYHNIPLRFEAGRYHSLMVNRDNLPDLLQIDAESDDGIIMGIKHKHHPVYGVQFHPESILSCSGTQLLRNFVTLATKNNESAKNNEEKSC